MACEGCRSQARSVIRVAVRTSRAPALTAATTTKRCLSSLGNNVSQKNSQQVRYFSRTSQRNMLEGIGGGSSKPYFVVAATESLYKICGEAANYRITEEDRKKDLVTKLDDGEEIGNSTSKVDVWHKTFNLSPTFSTWSHVTMLHLYLLNARVRQFDRDVYRAWQQQLIDHFFFEAEKKMHVDHNITSSALRQRYLKDIFVQWRGLLLAYDEGLVQGDAILASAVWRNLFKGDPEVDPRALAAIVGWMRASLKALEATSDYTFPTRASEILNVPVMNFWKMLEKGFKTQAISAEEPENINETAKPVTPVAAEVAKPTA